MLVVCAAVRRGDGRATQLGVCSEAARRGVSAARSLSSGDSFALHRFTATRRRREVIAPLWCESNSQRRAARLAASNDCACLGSDAYGDGVCAACSLCVVLKQRVAAALALLADVRRLVRSCSYSCSARVGTGAMRLRALQSALQAAASEESSCLELGARLAQQTAASAHRSSQHCNSNHYNGR